MYISIGKNKSNVHNINYNKSWDAIDLRFHDEGGFQGCVH